MPINELNRELAAASKTYTDTLHRLDKITADFYETGIAFFYEDLTNSYSKRRRAAPPLIHNTAMNRYLRQVARDLKRPYVKVEHYVRGDWDASSLSYTGRRDEWWLTMPRRRYTSPLVAHFLLLDPPPFFSSHLSGLSLVRGAQFGSTWQYRFAGANGYALLEHWLKQCREDPDFRKALRLPPITTGGNHGNHDSNRASTANRRANRRANQRAAGQHRRADAGDHQPAGGPRAQGGAAIDR
jgi:hypothetical protein